MLAVVCEVEPSQVTLSTGFGRGSDRRGGGGRGGVDVGESMGRLCNYRDARL